MGKTSFVSIMLWKAFIVRVSCGVQRKVKIFKSNFQFCVRSLWGWLRRGKSPNSWHSVNAFQASETSFSSQQTGLRSQCTDNGQLEMVQSWSNHYQWSNVMWWENSFSITSICYTDHCHCSEVFTWTLSDEVVSSSCRYEWEAERSWSCVRCCELYWYWVVMIV